MFIYNLIGGCARIVHYNVIICYRELGMIDLVVSFAAIMRLLCGRASIEHVARAVPPLSTLLGGVLCAL